MDLEAPSTRSLDGQTEEGKEDNARRSAHLDLNLAVTKDEPDVDGYDSQAEKAAWHYRNDVDMDGSEQQEMASISHRQRSMSRSPSPRPSTSSVGGRFAAMEQRQAKISANEQFDTPGRNSDPPLRQGSPSSGRSPSPPKERSPAPARVNSASPSPPRHHRKTGSQSPISKKEILPSSGGTRQMSSSPGRHGLAPYGEDPKLSTSPARLTSPSRGRKFQSFPSPANYRTSYPSRVRQESISPLRSSSPARSCQRSPSPMKQGSPLSRTGGSFPSARHISSPMRHASPQHVKERLPAPRRYSPENMKRDEFFSPRRHSPQGVRQRDISSSPRRCPYQDLKLRDKSPVPRNYSPRDVKQRNRSPLRHASSPRYRSPPPKKRYSPQGIQHRRGRSPSPSPVKQRDGYGGSGRGYRNRSRSRSPPQDYYRISPPPRDYYQRSPRRRYSPRRTPPRECRSRHRSPRRRPWSPPPNRNTGLGKPGKNLFIAGFSFLTTERHLEKKFSRFGRVTDVRIVRDKRTGDSRGFGFLSLERDEDADAAIQALDQTEWNGRIVLVEKSKTTAR
uniref:RRM domain-containing protein n=1 Tax=Araucaria cunninghamii TaxID=56994 RepID=A0A0D6QSP7_ARACU